MGEIYFRHSFYFINLNGNRNSVIPSIAEGLQEAREHYPVSFDRFSWDGDVLHYEPGRNGNQYDRENDKLLSKDAKDLIFASLLRRGIFSIDVIINIERADLY